MHPDTLDRIEGCAVGAAVADALGMPLEFGPRQPAGRLVRDMTPGRIPAGTFTDDTEMALALADSLLAHRPLDPADLAQRFMAWHQAGPDDVGIHTSQVLSRIAAGQAWQQAAQSVQRARPDSAGNGSVMRCWPVALAHWDELDEILSASRLQSRVTHPHPECQAGSAFVNAAIYHLLHGAPPILAIPRALEDAAMPADLRAVIEQAQARHRDELPNSGWVRHSLESAVWGLLTTDSFEEAVVQVVNLGADSDTAGAVTGALAGATYGLSAIPARWRDPLRGEWPLGSRKQWTAADLAGLGSRLAIPKERSQYPKPYPSGGALMTNYGSQSMIAPLRSVLVKRPGPAFAGADPARWHYTARPDLDGARQEHDALVEILRQSGAEVVYHDQPQPDRSDAIYVFDPVIVTDRGSIVLSMGKDQRRGEEAPLARRLEELGVPVYHALHGDARAEGGDLLWLDTDTLAVGLGFRTNAEALNQLAGAMAGLDVSVIPVELPYYTGPEACLHLLSLISIVDERLAVVYPALLSVPFWQELQARGFHFIEVPPEEFETMGPNVLALAPGRCLMLEGNPVTQRRLEAAGCTVSTYRGNEISLKAEGGPTCLTRPIWREEA